MKVDEHRVNRLRRPRCTMATRHLGDSAADRAAVKIKTMLQWGDLASPTPQITTPGRIMYCRVLMQRAESNHVVESFCVRSNYKALLLDAAADSSRSC